MQYIFVALFAYFLNCIAVLIDKFMLKKHFQNPLIYIFYISICSLVALFALPFTHAPSIPVFLLASISTLLWTTGAYFLYSALMHGLTSRVIPVIGAGIPLLLFFYSLGAGAVTFPQSIAICFLIGGLIAMTIHEWKGNITKPEMVFEFLSCLFFASSYILLRQAYLAENFFTVLVWSRMILVPVALLILCIPSLRNLVLLKKQEAVSKRAHLFFLFGQAAGGGSELLITFAISLADPALVNSLQGVQYLFLLFFSVLLARRFPEVFHERFTRGVLASKVIGIFFIGAGLYFLAFAAS